MALDTYGGLKTSIANFIARADLTTPIPDLVTLCHKQLMRELRGHPLLQKRDPAFSIDSEYEAVPSDFMSLRTMYLNTSPKTEVTHWAPDGMGDFSGSGKPRHVAIVGATTAGSASFRFAPVPDGTYTAPLEFNAMVTFFASDGATNWILTDHPDVYLYGSLLQAVAYIGDDPRIPQWQSFYITALQRLKAAGADTAWGTNGMAVRAV